MTVVAYSPQTILSALASRGVPNCQSPQTSLLLFAETTLRVCARSADISQERKTEKATSRSGPYCPMNPLHGCNFRYRRSQHEEVHHLGSTCCHKLQCICCGPPLASRRHQAARLLSFAAASNELGNLTSHPTSKPRARERCYEIASARSS